MTVIAGDSGPCCCVPCYTCDVNRALLAPFADSAQTEENLRYERYTEYLQPRIRNAVASMAENGGQEIVVQRLHTKTLTLSCLETL